MSKLILAILFLNAVSIKAMNNLCWHLHSKSGDMLVVCAPHAAQYLLDRMRSEGATTDAEHFKSVWNQSHSKNEQIH